MHSFGYIKLDDDGGIEVHENSADGKLIVAIRSHVFVGLDLFNEGRPGMTWEGDAQRSAELLLWRLEDHDLMPELMDSYYQEMRQLCMPGGPTGNPFVIKLVDAG